MSGSRLLLVKYLFDKFKNFKKRNKEMGVLRIID